MAGRQAREQTLASLDCNVWCAGCLGPLFRISSYGVAEAHHMLSVQRPGCHTEQTTVVAS
jgi:hypothetical protein